MHNLAVSVRSASVCAMHWQSSCKYMTQKRLSGTLPKKHCLCVADVSASIKTCRCDAAEGSCTQDSSLLQRQCTRGICKTCTNCICVYPVIVSAKTIASSCHAVGESSSRRALKERALQQTEPSSEGPPAERGVSEEPSSRKRPPAEQPSSRRALQQKWPQTERCHEAKMTIIQQMSRNHNTELAFPLWLYQQ